MTDQTSTTTTPAAASTSSTDLAAADQAISTAGTDVKDAAAAEEVATAAVDTVDAATHLSWWSEIETKAKALGSDVWTAIESVVTKAKDALSKL